MVHNQFTVKTLQDRMGIRLWSPVAAGSQQNQKQKQERKKQTQNQMQMQMQKQK